LEVWKRHQASDVTTQLLTLDFCNAVFVISEMWLSDFFYFCARISKPDTHSFVCGRVSWCVWQLVVPSPHVPESLDTCGSSRRRPRQTCWARRNWRAV